MLELQEKLENGFECFDSLDSLGKLSYILGIELWEDHFESLLALVKDYVVNIWETHKLKLYGDDSSQGMWEMLLSLRGTVAYVCVREVSLTLVNFRIVLYV